MRASRLSVSLEQAAPSDGRGFVRRKPLRSGFVALPCLALAGILILLAGLPGTPLQANAAGQEDAASNSLVPAVNVWYGPAPTVDGVIAPGEYAGANVLQFPGYGGLVTAYLRHDTANLYVAFDLPDTSPFPCPYCGGGPGPAVQLFLDTNDDRAAAPQLDDYLLTVSKGNVVQGAQGDGSSWGNPAGPGWSAAASTNVSGWRAEFSVSFAKLGITPGVARTIGLAFANVWTATWPKDYYWPAGGYYLKPDTWGEATSAENWSSWYFKAGGWADYAPNGVPDFDQKQDGWFVPPMPPNPQQWTYCGPVAAANSLWWFDSKFEPKPQAPSATAINDHYPLVYSYDPADQWDDHYPSNVSDLVNGLAGYFHTNPVTGTGVYKMYYGLQQYLYDRGLYDDYLVTLADQPSFQWVQDEVLHSEDVILLLGFWQETVAGYFQRIGGHYVTVAGVDPLTLNGQIAVSDPFADHAEAVGLPAAGRVLSGTLLHHQPIPGHGPDVHNDAGNVSHDFYGIQPLVPAIPAGTWGLVNYPPTPDYASNFSGVNPNPHFVSVPHIAGVPVLSVVEYAITVSPFTWKPGGWIDYGPSCMPDFSQKQDAWGNALMQWTYCGPAATADSLWWFDSKFEPDPQPPSATAINDHYALVQSYDPAQQWDDHAPQNVESNGLTPSVEFVDDLAAHMKTDVLASGTIITQMVSGTLDYIADHSLKHSYAVTKVYQPEWEWVVGEVSRCEDVVLLLGFWKYESGIWHRYGGHYVTVAGVDPNAGLAGLSDPFFDQAERGWPWLGRVWPLGELHPPHAGVLPDLIHNDAAFLSHDVYQAAPSPGPGGKWMLAGYPADDAWHNFEGLNGPQQFVPGSPPSDPNAWYTEVEWAMAVSPRPVLYVPLIMRNH